MVRFFTGWSLVLLFLACGSAGVVETPDPGGPALALRVEAIDQPLTRRMFGKQPVFEVLMSGMGWAEGPVVLPDGSVMVSDVEQNRINHLVDGVKTTAFYPSGGVADNYSREPGSNGLALHPDGDLLLCRHGARDLVKRALGKGQEGPVTVIADNFEGKKLNSPNDLVVASDGSILFTDPPYGLPGLWDSPLRELDFCGVYRAVSGQPLQLLTKAYSRPNGIGLSPDGKILYLANSDGSKAVVTATPILDEDFSLGVPRVLLDATELIGKEPGGTDGLHVAKNGRIFATAPGGVWVLEPNGRVIAKVRTGLKVANVTLDPSEDWLYLASDYYLIRIKIH